MTNWQTFFTHPMRPFFVASAVLAIAAALSFFVLPTAIILHRHLFLQLMLPAAYGGFLLAAMMEWTNFSGSLKNIAWLLGGLLLLAFVLLFVLPQASAWVILLYWLALLLFCIYLIYLDKNTDQFALLLILGAFVAVQAAFASTADIQWLKTQVHINMAAVMFVSFRVSVLIGNEALKDSSLKDPVFMPNPVYKNMAILVLLLYAVAEMYLPREAVGFAALGVGFILLAKLRELHYWDIWRKGYVRTYYYLQAFGATGYLWLGYAKLLQQNTATPLHLISIGAMLGAVWLVWLTAGLWHSGFSRLDYPKLCRVGLWCLLLATLCRTVLMPLAPQWLLMSVPALLVAAAFALYLCAFIPIFRQNPFTSEPE